MDSAYPAPPASYPIFNQSQWTDDLKPHFVAEPNEHSLDDSSLDPTHFAAPPPGQVSRRPSSLKIEDDVPSGEQMWHDRLPETHAQMRHYSQPQLMNRHEHQMMPVQDPMYMTTMPRHQQWPSSQSGSSTPTPVYGSMDGYAQMPFATGPSAFPSYHQDPNSAVPMSPQSSQGGWASATSSDGVEQRGMMQSPTYRPPSPTMVARSDGIRKKNARFEIPKDRNLSNIDAMIQQSTDETEKKELKQQKRLLRNRQAALDSRQRKKTHTEKLEQEKKISEKKMFELEEALARIEAQFTLEREQWLSQRQHMEQYIHSLQYERDEAIRSKTVESTELRRQNNILKDVVRDLERQPQKSFASAANMDSFDNEYEYELDETWEDEFGLNEFKVDEADQLNRQTTPKPSTVQTTLESKLENGFSGNTFYMCLLFGAFLAANWNNNASASTTTSAIASSISPSEAGNVLKAVLKGGDNELVPAQPQTAPSTGTRVAQTSVIDVGSHPTAPSSLDNLHQTLTAPSRRQELQAAFSLSASSYNHIMDPFNEHLTDGEPVLLEPAKPSQFQQALANMQAQKDEMERENGIGAQLRERSLLWDHVPPQVVKDFQELVKNSEGLSDGDNGERMEH